MTSTHRTPTLAGPCPNCTPTQVYRAAPPLGMAYHPTLAGPRPAPTRYDRRPARPRKRWHQRWIVRIPAALLAVFVALAVIGSFITPPKAAPVSKTSATVTSAVIA